MSQDKQNDKIIVALDFATSQEALNCVNELGETASFYKVGLELFTHSGLQMISELKKLNKKIFLDLKLYDIPNTVAKAVAQCTSLGIDFLTVHASGGEEMLARAQQAASEMAQTKGLRCPTLLAVTVLTSFKNFSHLGLNEKTADTALRLAKLAKKSAVPGLVCSPHEVELFRKELGEEIVLVTPGIRPAGAASDDQQRIATPQSALNSGANYLVIGRPITQAKDPAQAFQQILDDISA